MRTSLVRDEVARAERAAAGGTALAPLEDAPPGPVVAAEVYRHNQRRFLVAGNLQVRAARIEIGGPARPRRQPPCPLVAQLSLWRSYLPRCLIIPTNRLI